MQCFKFTTQLSELSLNVTNLVFPLYPSFIEMANNKERNL